MTRPRQPQTYSHQIYAHAAVRYFLLAIFRVSISIGTLESDSLSLNTPSRTIIYYCFTAQVLKVCMIITIIAHFSVVTKILNTL